jgi:hypothetical protein
VTRKQLEDYCESNEIFMDTYSPGDGVTRYRFFNRAGNDYFGPANGCFTALGIKEATAYAVGRAHGQPIN